MGVFGIEFALQTVQCSVPKAEAEKASDCCWPKSDILGIAQLGSRTDCVIGNLCYWEGSCRD